MRLLTALICLCLSLAANAAEYELIILAGQSNAQGWKGDASQYPVDAAADAQIPMWAAFPDHKAGTVHRTDGWVTLGPQAGRFPAGHFGPEVTLARAILADGGQPAVFKYSKGGTSLPRKWKAPGAGGLTDGMLSDLTKAVADLTERGDSYHVSAFIWIQGEADGGSDERGVALYADLFDQMVAEIARITGETSFPILLGVDDAINKTVIMHQHQRYAAEHDNARYTSMVGLEKADKTHLTPAGLIEHGKVLYTAYRELNPTGSK
jgi:hypothetical protein